MISMECIFCNIAKDNIKTQKLFENDVAFAILDIHPKAKGHAMVIPKAHVETLLQLPDQQVGAFFLAVKKMTAHIAKTLKPNGFTLGINHGEVSGQAVGHLHFHIIPRWKGDGGGSIHSVVNNAPKESLEEIAQLLAMK